MHPEVELRLPYAVSKVERAFITPHWPYENDDNDTVYSSVFTVELQWLEH